MTVTATATEATATGNGVATTFSLSPMVFLDTSDLLVYRVFDNGDPNELLVEVPEGESGINNYWITLTDPERLPTTGSITYPASGSTNILPIGESLLIQRRMEFIQETDLENQGGYFPEVQEQVYDRHILLMQQLQSDLTEATEAAGVGSFNGRIGTVVSQTGDYTAHNITNTPAGSIAAVTVQDALNELDAEKSSTSHTHAAAVITYAGSTNLVAANVEAALDELDIEKAGLALTNTFTDVQTVSRSGTSSLVLECTSGTANSGPIVDMYRNSASPADADLGAELRWSFNNSTPSKISGGSIFVEMVDEGAASEDFRHVFSNRIGGSGNNDRMYIGAGVYTRNVTGGDTGVDTANFTDYYDDGANINTLYQAKDGDLTALSALSTTGMMARTAADTYTMRTITGPAAGITVSDGNGVAGNPTLSLANDLSALEAMSGTGIVARTAAETYAQRTITAPAAGITVSNGDGVSANPTLALANDLSALEAMAGTGLVARTAAETYAQRTITAGNTGTTVTNGDGVAGNPTVSAIQPLLTKYTTGSGTHTLTTGVKRILVQAWGGGGSGGKGSNAAQYGGGGGGGSYAETWYDAALFSVATAAYAVGAGGAAQTVANTAGNAGGASTFNPTTAGVFLGTLSAFGGGGGGVAATGGGGGGGGGPHSTAGVGAVGAATVGGVGGGIGAGATAAAGVVGGGGGGTGATPTVGGHGGLWGGGGGGGGDDAAAGAGVGGASMFGGGGGGGACSTGAGPAGGVSIHAGGGGAGASDATVATTGTAPAGGGGGSEAGNSGAGANGAIWITEYF